MTGILQNFDSEESRNDFTHTFWIQGNVSLFLSLACVWNIKVMMCNLDVCYVLVLFWWCSFHRGLLSAGAPLVSKCMEGGKNEIKWEVGKCSSLGTKPPVWGCCIDGSFLLKSCWHNLSPFWCRNQTHKVGWTLPQVLCCQYMRRCYKPEPNAHLLPAANPKWRQKWMFQSALESQQVRPAEIWSAHTILERTSLC